MIGNIVLLTDFGPKGQHYVASMKGVILKINPNIYIHDLSHNVSPYSIIEASYLIKTTYIYYPEGTVFIVVVDPGVGSSREILALKTKSNHYFIGPNNGIFSNALSDEIIECVKVQNDAFFNKPISTTFHGRDIMAPVGAHILCGIPLTNFGPKFDLKYLKKYSIDYEFIPKDKKIRCTIQYIDCFGNGTTNILIEKNSIKGIPFTLGENTIIKIQFKNKTFEGNFTKRYSEVPIGSLLILKGSTGFLEISKNQGNAAEDLGFKVGDIITISL
ncbi:MAG: SAM hydrolase/SAM-dependent halogenase family protein [Promethearchaeota archaeon]